jgi:hypothetical protein
VPLISHIKLVDTTTFFRGRLGIDYSISHTGMREFGRGTEEAKEEVEEIFLPLVPVFSDLFLFMQLVPAS